MAWVGKCGGTTGEAEGLLDLGVLRGVSCKGGGSVTEKFGAFVVTGLRVWHLEEGEGRVRYQESKIWRPF